uniref:Phospholipid/glycerol acyltransferase domain-containing protein n=1 Tax=Brassica campestris TaxID=3711 RepID=M4E5K8_BRACM
MSKSHGCFSSRDSAMDVASARGVSSHPPYYSKPICSSQSSLIRIPINKGCCFARSSNLITSLHAAPRGVTRRTSGVQWCNRSIRFDPFKVNDKNSRTVTVRSDLSGAATAESTYPEPEIKLSSRLRGICFCLVAGLSAIVLIVLMIIGHPFVLLFDRYRRKFHHFIAKLWASISIYPFYKTDIQGLENLPSSDTPCVYVSNHQSFLDIYTLLSLGQSYKFISKTGIFVIPVIGWAMSMMGVVPLKRMDPRSQVDCLKRCMELVKKGASVFFFPEGTRSKDGRLGPFKVNTHNLKVLDYVLELLCLTGSDIILQKGAFTIAAKTGVPVVPITLMGTGKIMPTGSEGILNHGDVRVIIHKPIYGSKADVLCDEARNKIAESMNLLS